MPETPGAELRIYCICGQKMKVSAAMFGRPGKCVACRQKIRIPRPDDLPGDTVEVHLREHPEFLRRTLPPADQEADGGEEAVVELGGDGANPVDATPVDVLERLRVLCSLDHKLRKAIEDPHDTGDDHATLLGYRTLVRKLRRDLEDQLRKDLIETGGSLTRVKEQIADTSMSFRIGDLGCAAFLNRMLELRREREALERRRQNLRGWLMVDDPYAAGGYVDVKFEDIPCDTLKIDYPPEIRAEKALVDYYSTELREALRRLEHTDRKIEEWARMAREGAMSSADLAEANAGTGAEWRRAQGAAAFCRERLAQVVQDCELDILSAKARRDASRKQREAGEIDPETHRQADLDFVRIESDNLRAKELALRAMAAKSAEDVPSSRGTFLRRMAKPKTPAGPGADSLVAWVASVLMVVNIVVPISDAQVAGNMVVMQGLVLGLFLTATALALAAAIPTRGLRGVLINLVFVGGTLGGAHYINSTWYGLDTVGEAMRANPRWMLAPGVILFALADVVMALAAILSLAVVPRMRWVPVVSVVVVAGGVAGVFTDFAGLTGPKPSLLQREEHLISSTSGTRDVIFRVTNRGGRPIWVSTGAMAGPVPVRFSVSRKMADGTWQEVGRPEALKRAASPSWLPVLRSTIPAEMLGKGDIQEYQFELPPGTYRARLDSNIPGYQQQIQDFYLEPIGPPAPGASASVPSRAPRLEDFPGKPLEQAPTIRLHQVGARLRGVVDGNGRNPLFTVNVELPGGQVLQRRISLGDPLYGPWVAEEFNPGRNTLTVNDGTRRMVLQTGESVALAVPKTDLE